MTCDLIVIICNAAFCTIFLCYRPVAVEWLGVEVLFFSISWKLMLIPGVNVFSKRAFYKRGTTELFSAPVLSNACLYFSRFEEAIGRNACRTSFE